MGIQPAQLRFCIFTCLSHRFFLFPSGAKPCSVCISSLLAGQTFVLLMGALDPVAGIPTLGLAVRVSAFEAAWLVQTQLLLSFEASG